MITANKPAVASDVYKYAKYRCGTCRGQGYFHALPPELLATDRTRRMVDGKEVTINHPLINPEPKRIPTIWNVESQKPKFVRKEDRGSPYVRKEVCHCAVKRFLKLNTGKLKINEKTGEMEFI